MNIKSFYTLMGGCTCPNGFVMSAIPGLCTKVETSSPTVSHSDYCLAASRRIEYSSFKSRIYNPGFSNSSIALSSAPSAEVYGEMTDPGQWLSTTSANGPMNRAAIWIDPNCDGVINGSDTLPASGTQVTFSFKYNNVGLARTVFVGIGADNQFQLKVNTDDIASTTSSSATNNFYIWHIFPVNLIQGVNYFNAVAIGDGSINDAIGMTIYDNTAAQLVAATTDNNVGLTVLFSSESLIGQHIDLATCASGYELDTSGGQGNYICKRITTISCS